MTGNDNHSPRAAAAEETVTVGASTLGNERASQAVPSSNHSRAESRPRHSRAGGETSTRRIQQPESPPESTSSIYYFPPIRVKESTPVPSPSHSTRHSSSKRPRLGQSRSRQQRHGSQSLGPKNILNTMDTKVRH